MENVQVIYVIGKYLSTMIVTNILSRASEAGSPTNRSSSDKTPGQVLMIAKLNNQHENNFGRTINLIKRLWQAVYYTLNT